MKDAVKQAISRKLVRLALEMKDTANLMKESGLTEKAHEMYESARQTCEWAQEVVK